MKAHHQAALVMSLARCHSRAVFRARRMAKGQELAGREQTRLLLVSVDALPQGSWTIRDDATAPTTRRAWDRRAKAAGCVTVIRSFSDGRRTLRVQVRPLTRPEDALRVMKRMPETMATSVRLDSNWRVVDIAKVAVPSELAESSSCAICKGSCSAY